LIRVFDIIFSFISLIIFCPIILPILIILRFTGEGEVFYKQPRVGINGKIFNLLKLATMLKNSPTIGTKNITLKNDPRILPVGKFLRSSKLNEIPQLLNIFLGDMSFIGPRPLTEDKFLLYNLRERLIISSVTPGLSGVGSIIFRNEENLFVKKEDINKIYTNEIIPYKAKLEIWYVKNRSLRMNIILIYYTLLVVLFPKLGKKIKLLKKIPTPTDFLKKRLF